MFARLLHRTHVRIKSGMSITWALGHMLGGGRLELDEGIYFINEDYDQAIDNITIVGQGELTRIYLENDAALTWSGENGRLLNVKVDGVTAGARGGLGYIITATGARWIGKGIHTVNGHQIITMTGDDQKLLHCRIEGQSAVGVYATGDRATVFGNECDASAIANEIIVNGLQCYVMANYCIGGGIAVGSGTSYAPAGSNFI